MGLQIARCVAVPRCCTRRAARGRRKHGGSFPCPSDARLASPTCGSRSAMRPAEGLPLQIRENAKPQSAIAPRLVAEVGSGMLRDMVVRRKARLLGKAVHPPQTVVFISRLSDAFRIAPLAVAITSLRVVCNAVPTKEFGGACRVGCNTVVGDDAQHYLFCPVVVGVAMRDGAGPGGSREATCARFCSASRPTQLTQCAARELAQRGLPFGRAHLPQVVYRDEDQSLNHVGFGVSLAVDSRLRSANARHSRLRSLGWRCALVVLASAAWQGRQGSHPWPVDVSALIAVSLPSVCLVVLRPRAELRLLRITLNNDQAPLGVPRLSIVRPEVALQIGQTGFTRPRDARPRRHVYRSRINGEILL